MISYLHFQNEIQNFSLNLSEDQSELNQPQPSLHQMRLMHGGYLNLRGGGGGNPYNYLNGKALPEGWGVPFSGLRYMKG